MRVHNKVRRTGGVVLALLLATALHAQLSSQSSNLDGMQNANAVYGMQNANTMYGMQNASAGDCSDPLMANSSRCYGQSGENNGLQGSLAGSGETNEPQLRNSNLNYSDTESLTQKTQDRNQPQPVKLPPELLTEFQKFIVSSTGQILPIYGANLFSTVPSTFAPLDLTPVPPDYVVGPGDELRIRVWGQVSFRADVRVDRSGEIFLPQIGLVHVAGMPFSALDEHLRGAIGHIYRNFSLAVDVGQIRAIQIYVSGQARRPGVYTVSSLSTLVDALFSSGGPSAQGSMRRVELRRGNTAVTNFDLYDLLIRGDKSKDVKLQSGDVIFIPPVGPQAAITGSVRTPAIYELKAEESLAGLLASAGGATSVVSQARISIERIAEHRDRYAMEVTYNAAGLATPLADGDLVRVYSIVPAYRNTVILRGNTANSGRFAWRSGMHISDLIPDKESLITRNYWWKRSQLGLPAEEFEPIPGLNNLRQSAESRAITIKAPSQQEMSNSNQFGSQRNPSGYQQGQSGYQQGQSGYQQGQYGYLQGQQSGYGYQQEQSGYSQNQNLTADQRAGNVSLAVAQTSSSAQDSRPGQLTEVRALAPEIDWDYAVIERLSPETLKTTLIPFDLGKLVLQHDASQDLELQAGDVVTVFSEADIHVPLAHRTRTVMLGGEVVHAGAYTVQPEETLRKLVERAGGLTPDAYLFGSEFTRESTRVVQQIRIDEYVQNLSMRIQRSSLSIASSPVSSAQNMASGAMAQNSERDLLASLRQIRATGRIVLRFAPDSRGTDNIPDVALEDGDHFIVPSAPAIVNVVGAVYDQNSFMYSRGLKVSAYLKQAGGPTRDADWKHEFIIHANGEVVSRERDKTVWGGNTFDDQRIYPGDTIMVPERTFKQSAMRAVLDWTQAFSQLALGSAVASNVF